MTGGLENKIDDPELVCHDVDAAVEPMFSLARLASSSAIWVDISHRRPDGVQEGVTWVRHGGCVGEISEGGCMHWGKGLKKTPQKKTEDSSVQEEMRERQREPQGEGGASSMLGQPKVLYIVSPQYPCRAEALFVHGREGTLSMLARSNQGLS